jgi:hypothetical protein
MKLKYLTLIAALTLSHSAMAIDAADRSPSDKNPKCLDPKVDSSTGDCIIKDEGATRHKYPPKVQVKSSSTSTGVKTGGASK